MLKTIDFGFASCSAHEQSDLLTAPMAFQMVGARHICGTCGALWTVEPCGANLTSNHPGPPHSPRSWWNSGGTLVEPSWNLTSGPPRTTPEPIWAETPKLSAVGEKGVYPQSEDGPMVLLTSDRIDLLNAPKVYPRFLGQLSLFSIHGLTPNALELFSLWGSRYVTHQKGESRKMSPVCQSKPRVRGKLTQAVNRESKPRLGVLKTKGRSCRTSHLAA